MTIEMNDSNFANYLFTFSNPGLPRLEGSHRPGSGLTIMGDIQLF